MQSYRCDPTCYSDPSESGVLKHFSVQFQDYVNKALDTNRNDHDQLAGHVANNSSIEIYHWLTSFDETIIIYKLPCVSSVHFWFF